MRQVWLSEGMNAIRDSPPHFRFLKTKKINDILQYGPDNEKDFMLWMDCCSLIEKTIKRGNTSANV